MHQQPNMYPAQHPPFNPPAPFPANSLSNGHTAPVNGNYGPVPAPQMSYPAPYNAGPPLGMGQQPVHPHHHQGNFNNDQIQPASYDASSYNNQQPVSPVQSLPPDSRNHPAAFHQPQPPPPQQPQQQLPFNKMNQYAAPPGPVPVQQQPPPPPASNHLHENHADNGVTYAHNNNMMHQMPHAPGPGRIPPGLHQQQQPPHVPQHQMPPAQMHGHMNQGYGGYGYGGPQPQPHQPQQRLDPDAMPSVVQVIQDDQEKYSRPDNVIFATSIPAVVPPLLTSIRPESIIHDGGSVRPQHLTCTMYQVPVSEDVQKASAIPLGIVIKPFDESEVDGTMTIPITASEIIRCNRCRAYMSPYMRFVDGGRRFQCALCHHISEVSQTYYAHLDHMGHRLDRYERPELYLGSYEFKATSEFCRNSILNCRRPHIVFAFELTINSVPVIRRILNELPTIIREHLPVDALRRGTPPPLVGFMTYNSKIQLYDVRGDGRAHVICDVTQTFPPITSFLADPVEHADKIDR
jgi:protein transport protein SEC24